MVPEDRGQQSVGGGGPTSMDTKGALTGVVDMLENILGVDVDGDGSKGQGYGLVDGLEAVTGIDIDGDGTISAHELRRMIESRGYFVGFKECEQVIDKMDRNKDGRVSFAEFAEESR